MSKLKFGFADTIITPINPEYVYIDGYADRTRPADGVRDDLHAKVCAIMDNDRVFLIFSLDLVGLRSYTYELISSQIHNITGIPKENFALCCIHTHAAPATGLLDGLPIDTDYFAYVGERCAKIAKQAMDRACYGSFRFEILPEKLISCHNRRRGRDVIDRTIRAAAFHDQNGELRGVICTAACHAVVCTDYKLSADWLSVLNRMSGDEVPYLYFQGRGADIDPEDFYKFPIDEFVERLGTELVNPIKRFVDRTSAGDLLEADLKWEYENVRIPMKQMNDQSCLQQSIQKYLNEYLDLSPNDIQKHYKLRKLEWYRHMLRIAKASDSFDITVPLQYLAIGKTAVFAFVPFEVLTLTGNKLEDIFAKIGFERQAIYICGYSNIVEGYLAPREEFEFGGYEVSGAAHVYNISETIPESEETILNWFSEKAQKL